MRPEADRTRLVGSGTATGVKSYRTVIVDPAVVATVAVMFPEPVPERVVPVPEKKGTVSVPGPLKRARSVGAVETKSGAVALAEPVNVPVVTPAAMVPTFKVKTGVAWMIKVSFGLSNSRSTDSVNTMFLAVAAELFVKNAWTLVDADSEIVTWVSVPSEVSNLGRAIVVLKSVVAWGKTTV
jgi:hypothetical protein